MEKISPPYEKIQYIGDKIVEIQLIENCTVSYVISHYLIFYIQNSGGDSGLQPQQLLRGIVKREMYFPQEKKNRLIWTELHQSEI